MNCHKRNIRNLTGENFYMSGNKRYFEECNHHTNTIVEIKSVQCICCSFFFFFFFLSHVIFGLLLLLGKLMYANEVETIRKIKITLGKK